MIKASYLIPTKSGNFIDVQEIIDKSVLFCNRENPLAYILFLEADPKEESIILHIVNEKIEIWDYQTFDKQIRKLILNDVNQRLWDKIDSKHFIYHDIMRNYFVDNFTLSNPFPA